MEAAHTARSGGVRSPGLSSWSRTPCSATSEDGEAGVREVLLSSVYLQTDLVLGRSDAMQGTSGDPR